MESNGPELNPSAFHLGNLFLHAICVLLVFRLLRRLTCSDVAACMGALLFALHKQGRLARQQLKDIGADELDRALSFAANCAGLTCTRPGADPPWSHEVTWSW